MGQPLAFTAPHRPVPCCCPPPPRLQCTYQMYLAGALQSSSSDSASQHPLLRTPLMDAAEVELVLRGFNNTDLPYDRQAFVHGQFMTRAQETPDAVCVVFEDYEFTYAEVGAGCLIHSCRVHVCTQPHSEAPPPAVRAADAPGRKHLPSAWSESSCCCVLSPDPATLASAAGRLTPPPTASPTT